MLSFPASPAEGQQYNDTNGKVWEFDGVKWNIATTSFLKTFYGARLSYTGDVFLTSTLSPIPWETTQFDTANFFNNANPTVVTIPRTGYYRINLTVETGQEGFGQAYTIQLKRNTQVILEEKMAAFQSGTYEQTLLLNVGDTLQFLATEVDGVGVLQPGTILELELKGYTFGGSILPGFAFSGVKSVLNSNVATTVTPTAISWVANDIIFNVNADAIGNTYWNETEPTKFTIYVSGYYRVKAYFNTGTDGSADSYTVALRVDGTTTLESITLGAEETVELDSTYFLGEGEYLEIVISNTENIGTILAANSLFEISRLGV